MNYYSYKYLLNPGETFAQMLTYLNKLALSKKGYLILRKAKLKNADLKGVNLRETHLINADLEGVNFTRAKLKRVNFFQSNLKKANFNYADLSCSTFVEVEATEVSFKYANLTEANFYDAKVQKANFSCSNLFGAIFKYADLKGANLFSAITTSANFERANLQGVYLDYSSLPLWCGGIGVKIDEKILKQIINHTLKQICPESKIYTEIKQAFLNNAEWYQWLEDWNHSDMVLPLNKFIDKRRKNGEKI